jgi:hypothetical protein
LRRERGSEHDRARQKKSFHGYLLGGTVVGS